MTKFLLDFTTAALFVALATSAAGAEPRAGDGADEPNVKVASQWWPEMPNVWTPVGWKNHLFRFNVLHTGAIVAEPHPASPFGKKHTEAFAGQGVQLAFIPSADGALPPARGEQYQLTDANANLTGRQGWTTNATPVLWTEWRQPHLSLNGITLKQEVFGHIAGAADVQRGDEPLFGWVRISVAEKLEPIPRENVSLLVKINAPHTQWSMWQVHNLVMMPGISKYPRALSVEAIDEKRPGRVVTEQGGKVRLAVLPGGADAVEFIDKTAKGGLDHWLHITLPAEKGAFVDLLVPYVPTDRAAVDAEMKLGYDAALKESDAYWSRKPPTAAEISTPEPLVNGLLAMTPKLAEIIAEKNPQTGRYAALCGSVNYASVWGTPQSMQMHMLLDPLGYHDVAARYLAIYKDTQGSAKPPGPSYGKHAGYLGAPRSVSSVDWVTDHGAILHAIAQHGLLSGDQRFIDEYADTVVRACEFIRDARRMTNHAGAKGVLPPASATDSDVPEQALWSDGWNYKGLTSAVKFLRLAGRTEAADAFAKESADYKAAFRDALREKMKGAKTWQDSRGRPYPLVPTAFSNGNENHPFYLDTGPLFLVFAGLMDADDDVMRTILHYFRDGPNHRTFDPAGNFHQPAVLVREMSSCEPCYSWNIYHSWQRGDRGKFLEGMYSLITGGMSRQTFISSEHRGGISGTQFVAPLAVHLLRLSVVDDEIEPDALHLLRLCPRAWVSSEQESSFQKMPTIFGPANLRFGLSADGKTLDVAFDADWRQKPKRILLHVPPVAGITHVKLNGEIQPVQPEIQVPG